MAIGYRTGLFDAMDEFDSPQPVDSIAKKAGLNSRYITEWLGIMVTGRIVELLQSADGIPLFSLPKHRADVITRRAGESNLGVYTQEIPLLTAAALEPVIQGFKTGAGVSYDHYPDFQQFMSQLANAKHQRVLVTEFLPAVDRGRLVKRLQNGIRVCDLGCAEGVAVRLMAEAFPRSRFVGIDISEEAIAAARKETRHQQLRNLEFKVLDAARLRDSHTLQASFDYVTAFDAIHDQTHPLDALRGIHHILAPEGRFSMVDIAAQSDLVDNLDHPMGPFLYTVSLMHCMPVGLVDGGAGLGMMWGRQQAVRMLEKAGFQSVEEQEIPNDPFNFHFFCRK
jgi:ubiquinone/menaquinone biosynthesis C-methylase UbiE